MKSGPAKCRNADVMIYFDRAAECLSSYFSEITLNDHGIIFRSRWEFDLGTQLALKVCVEPEYSDSAPVCIDLTGMVVHCERVYCQSPLFEVTLLFLNRRERPPQSLDQLTRRPELMGNLN
jgi:hypothetical protein